MSQRDLGSEITWYLRTLPQHLGRLGIAGMVLGAAAALAWFFYLGPTSTNLNQTSQFLEARRATIASELAQLPPERARSHEPQDALYAESEFQSAIERFIELAQQHSLVLMQGAYKVDTERDSSLRLAVLNFPAQGNYVALREFLEDAHKLPGVRLQSLQINRVAGSETDITVQMQFAMLLRP